MRNTYCRTWNLARKQINEENETHTLEHLEYSEKTEKHGTGHTHTHKHCRSWKMLETVKNVQKEK
jgi:hypothetical protein